MLLEWLSPDLVRTNLGHDLVEVNLTEGSWQGGPAGSYHPVSGGLSGGPPSVDSADGAFRLAYDWRYGADCGHVDGATLSRVADGRIMARYSAVRPAYSWDGVAWFNGGEAVVLDRGAGRMDRIDLATNTTQTVAMTGIPSFLGGRGGPHDVLSLQDRNTVLLDSYHGAAYVLHPDGALQRLTVTGVQTLDAQGNDVLVQSSRPGGIHVGVWNDTRQATVLDVDGGPDGYAWVGGFVVTPGPGSIAFQHPDGRRGNVSLEGPLAGMAAHGHNALAVTARANRGVSVLTLDDGMRQRAPVHVVPVPAQDPVPSSASVPATGGNDAGQSATTSRADQEARPVPGVPRAVLLVAFVFLAWRRKER